MFEAGSQLPVDLNCFTVEIRVEFQVWSVWDCRCCRKDHNYPMDLYYLTINIESHGNESVTARVPGRIIVTL